RALATRLERSAGGRDLYSRDLTGRLALQLLLVQHGIEDVRVRAPIEVALTVSPSLEAATDTDSSRQWCETVLAMYRGWARARHMQLSESSEGALPLLIVTGFGAARTLLAEQGLHILESSNDSDSPRIVARVKVIAVPNDLSDAHRKQGSIAAAL